MTKTKSPTEEVEVKLDEEVVKELSSAIEKLVNKFLKKYHPQNVTMELIMANLAVSAQLSDQAGIDKKEFKKFAASVYDFINDFDSLNEPTPQPKSKKVTLN